MDRLRFVTLKTLKMIRDRGYVSQNHKTRYNPIAIEIEIHRKTKHKDKPFVRTIPGRFNRIHATDPTPYKRKEEE